MSYFEPRNHTVQPRSGGAFQLVPAVISVIILDRIYSRCVRREYYWIKHVEITESLRCHPFSIEQKKANSSGRRKPPVARWLRLAARFPRSLRSLSPVLTSSRSASDRPLTIPPGQPAIPRPAGVCPPPGRAAGTGSTPSRLSGSRGWTAEARALVALVLRERRARDERATRERIGWGGARQVREDRKGPPARRTPAT